MNPILFFYRQTFHQEDRLTLASVSLGPIPTSFCSLDFALRCGRSVNECVFM